MRIEKFAAVRIRYSAIALALAAAACSKKQEPLPIETAPVERRDIVVTAQANGAVEPINVVEVKSKASGLITKMPVDVGSLVKTGDLLVQIDTRDVQNQYNQALADLQSAQVKLQVSTIQRNRAKELITQGIITAQENEAAILDYASSQAAVVRARTNLDLAKQRLEDATVRAPVVGTIIEKPVSLGQVITSATSSASGGTTILKMADLTQVRMRALVNETDIGNVRPGQEATVTVDAYPDRRFTGIVEKVEPEAVVQQSVTMFPVLVSLSNPDGSLKPGMNGEAVMLVERRLGVLAIPNDAVRSMRELTSVATALGLNPDSVRAQMRNVRGGFGGGPAAQSSTAPVATGTRPAAGGQGMDSAARAARRAQRARSGGDTVRRSFGGGAGSGTGGGNFGAGRRGTGAGATQSGGFTASGGSTPGVGQSGGKMQLVFVKKDEKFSARLIRTGVSDFDYTEVIDGLQEGEQVALLAAAALEQRRQEQNQRIRTTGPGALPGMQRPTTGTAAGGGGGGPGPGR